MKKEYNMKKEICKVGAMAVAFIALFVAMNILQNRTDAKNQQNAIKSTMVKSR